MTWKVAHALVALLLAGNYFAFQVELFEEEFEQNQPLCDFSHELRFTSPTLNWESFDKTNAPQAFTLNPDFRIFVLFEIPSPTNQSIPAQRPFSDIRDKSPPLSIA